MRVGVATLCLAAAVVCQAQPPAIGQNGVVNAASRIPTTLRRAAIARGARFTISGVRLGSNSSAVKVTLRSGERVVPVSVRSVQSDRIEAIMPASAPLGEDSLSVETGAGVSRPFPVPVASSAVGLYSGNEKGWGQGRIEVGGHSNAPGNPARPGQMAAVLSTGLGSASRASIVIGGKPAPIASIDRGIEPGVDRIRFRVPSDAPEGCYVPLYVQVAGAPRSNVVAMSIESHAAHCRTPGSEALAPEGATRFGVIGLSRTTMLYADGGPHTTIDEAFGAVVAASPASAGSSPLLAIPPEGVCTAFTGSYQSGMPGLNSFPDALLGMLQGNGLNAGKALAVEGSRGTLPVPQSAPGSYWVRLGLEEPGIRSNHPLFFAEPSYVISSSGGTDAGAFQRRVSAPAAFTWGDEGEHASVSLARGTSVQWKGMPGAALVLVFAMSLDQLSTASGMCLCAATPQAGGIAIPPEMLAYFPETREMPGRPTGLILIVAMQFAAAAAPPVSGLDLLSTISAYARGRRVIYR